MKARVGLCVTVAVLACAIASFVWALVLCMHELSK